MARHRGLLVADHPEAQIKGGRAQGGQKPLIGEVVAGVDLGWQKGCQGQAVQLAALLTGEDRPQTGSRQYQLNQASCQSH
jgi:hypothetical protein